MQLVQYLAPGTPGSCAMRYYDAIEVCVIADWSESEIAQEAYDAGGDENCQTKAEEAATLLSPTTKTILHALRQHHLNRQRECEATTGGTSRTRT